MRGKVISFDTDRGIREVNFEVKRKEKKRLLSGFLLYSSDHIRFCSTYWHKEMFIYNCYNFKYFESLKYSILIAN